MENYRQCADNDLHRKRVEEGKRETKTVEKTQNRELLSDFPYMSKSIYRIMHTSQRYLLYDETNRTREGSGHNKTEGTFHRQRRSDETSCWEKRAILEETCLAAF